MNILNAIEERKSIRFYQDVPVPKETVEAILEKSLRSPSPTNIQPWNIYVVNNPTLDDLRKDNEVLFLSGVKPTEEEPVIQGIFRERRIELAKDLFKMLEIAREDKAKRAAWTAKGYRYFDAPVAIIITVNKEVLSGTWAVLGIGTLIQSICLIANEYGLGTCISEQGVGYHDVLKKHLNIPEEEKAIISITLGYAEENCEVNEYKSNREPLENVSHWFWNSEG